MRKMTLALVLVTVAMLGCVAFPTKRTPKLDKPRRAPELRSEPVIRLVVNDLTGRPERMERALERARAKFPYLKNASEDTPDPDYTIFLSADYSATESGINEFAYATMLVIPAIHREEVSVWATVYDADGQVIGEAGSTGGAKTAAQLHLLWIAPISAPLAVHSNKKMWTRSFRDALIQASRLIAEDQQKPAVTEEVIAARAPSF